MNSIIILLSSTNALKLSAPLLLYGNGTDSNGVDKGSQFCRLRINYFYGGHTFICIFLALYYFILGNNLNNSQC